jgi:hypothetical protein
VLHVTHFFIRFMKNFDREGSSKDLMKSFDGGGKAKGTNSLRVNC